MHDGITLEQRSIPTAVICTVPFITSAKAMNRLKGVPDYPFVLIEHPVGSLTTAEIRARAQVTLPQVIEILIAKH